jgi:hypothetical protein
VPVFCELILAKETVAEFREKPNSYHDSCRWKANLTQFLAGALIPGCIRRYLNECWGLRAGLLKYGKFQEVASGDFFKS